MDRKNKAYEKPDISICALTDCDIISTSGDYDRRDVNSPYVQGVFSW